MQGAMGTELGTPDPAWLVEEEVPQKVVSELIPEG